VRQVVAAGADAARVESLERLGESIGIPVEASSAPDDEAARALVDRGDADIAIAADGSRLTTDEPVDLAGDSEMATLLNVLRNNLALDNGLVAAGLTPDEAAEVRATPPPAVDALQAEDPDEVDSSRFATTTVTNILLFIMLQTYGSWVLTGVTREKASRVVEVLLAMITPRQLLTGKIVGIGTVALVHALVLIVTAYVTSKIVGVDLAAGLSLGGLSISVVWFLLGYALYCGAYAAAGALVSRVEDAQSAAFPIMLPLLVGYLLSFSAIGGASTLLWVLAFIPFTGVIVMPTLYTVGEAELWHVGVAMALTVVTIVVVLGVAAKVYERSVLHSGRKLSWKEAFRRPAEITAA
jgi:ABC-2 type transport system permease protein